MQGFKTSYMCNMNRIVFKKKTIIYHDNFFLLVLELFPRFIFIIVNKDLIRLNVHKFAYLNHCLIIRIKMAYFNEQYQENAIKKNNFTKYFAEKYLFCSKIYIYANIFILY